MVQTDKSLKYKGGKFQEPDGIWDALSCYPRNCVQMPDTSATVDSSAMRDTIRIEIDTTALEELEVELEEG